MTDAYVTQCPQCQTRFRVTVAQLGAAQGAVRCGTCLHIFNAAEQLGLTATPAATSAQAEASTATTTATVTAPPAAAPVTPPTHDAKPASASADDPNDISPVHLPLNAPTAAMAERTSQPCLDLDQLDLDEELAKLSLEHVELHPKTTMRAASPPLEDTSNDDPPLGNLSSTQNSLETAAVGRLSAERDDIHTPHHTAAPRLRHEVLRSLQDEPMQLKRPAQPRWGRRLFWGSLFLLVLGALPAQYLYLNFDALSRQPAWRPWLKQGCRIVGCYLPPLVDISLIRSSNLVVRTHPERPGALKVDAILYNRASYPQPFPILELRFADFNGQNMSSLRFKPTDYLEGEVKAGDSMPPQTPVHIRLEVLDPGVQAAGYSLEFHSPE